MMIHGSSILRAPLAPLFARGLGAMVVLGLTFGCSQGASWHQVPEGKKVKLLALGHFEVPGETPVLRLRYASSLPLSDTVGVRNEARALWPYLRHIADSAGYQNAALLSEQRSRRWCFPLLGACVTTSYGMLWRRLSSGEWKETLAAPP